MKYRVAPSRVATFFGPGVFLQFLYINERVSAALDVPRIDVDLILTDIPTNDGERVV